MKQISGKTWTSRQPRTYRTPRTGEEPSSGKRTLGTGDVGALLRELAKCHDSGLLSKQQYQRLMLLACSVYIGQEVEKQVGHVLEETFSPERMARYFSFSH